MWARAFNSRGIQTFRNFLNSYQEGIARIEDAEQLAASTQLSDLVEPRINIDIPRTYLKRELAELVVNSFNKAGYDELPTHTSERNRGMWTWLAAASFHLIRSRAVRSAKPLLRDYSYYILSEDALRYYRHRVAGPARIHWILRNTPHNTRIFLNSEIHQVSEFEERLAVNMRYISNPELMAALNILYLDPKTLRQKRGCVSDPNTRGGVLKRFMNVIDQLDRTYDLHSMSADQILDLLPTEFDRWKPNHVA